jgi:hypothetical protein
MLVYVRLDISPEHGSDFFRPAMPAGLSSMQYRISIVRFRNINPVRFSFESESEHFVAVRSREAIFDKRRSHALP